MKIEPGQVFVSRYFNFRDPYFYFIDSSNEDEVVILVDGYEEVRFDIEYFITGYLFIGEILSEIYSELV